MWSKDFRGVLTKICCILSIYLISVDSCSYSNNWITQLIDSIYMDSVFYALIQPYFDRAQAAWEIRKLKISRVIEIIPMMSLLFTEKPEMFLRFQLSSFKS